MSGKHWKTCSVVLLNEVHSKAGSSQLVQREKKRMEQIFLKSLLTRRPQVAKRKAISQEILIRFQSIYEQARHGVAMGFWM